jgi:tetratricopeptide (TPR) repeat protein
MHWNMNSNEQQTAKVIQYLDGELTGDELKAFEILLSQDEALQTQLQNMQVAKQAVRHYGLKQQVASVHKDMMDELRGKPVVSRDAKVIPFVRYTMRIAAVLLVMIIAFSAYEFVTVSPATVLPLNTPYALSIERGAAETSAVEKAYAENNYKAVINIFEKETNPAAKDRFLAGQSYLATQQPAKAIEAFTGLVNTSSVNDFKDDAEFYLGMSYLQNNEPAKAKALLKKIYKDKDHLYHDKVSYFTILKLNMLILKSGN